MPQLASRGLMPRDRRRLRGRFVVTDHASPLGRTHPTEGNARSSPRRGLRLYVYGETPGAMRALASRRRLIEAAGGVLTIEVIDIEVDPQAAELAGVLATPTLSDESVHPPRRLIGDFGDIQPTLEYFGLHPSASSE